ncbi:hypothetical protein OG800_49290 (plasmid) [Streptomyces sp. NBC_00445]|uniref:hypothetical protein n=1 Tax=Streptomyces sp. NBC_00445 TaxID=2975745 RepID=UPI002E203A22
MDRDPLKALLARAASGDEEAAAQFTAYRAALTQGRERLRRSAHAAAWRMIQEAE